MPETRPKPTATAHVIAILAIAIIGAILHRDFAEQWFYADDFGYLQRARDITVAEHIAHYAGTDWRLWRPGHMLMVDALYSVVGTNAPVYTAVALLLHSCAALLVYVAVVWSTRSAWLGTGGAALLMSAPAASEAIYWMTGATTILVPALLNFLAGLVFMHAAASERTRRWPFAAAFGMFCLSLTFRETAYHLPPVIATAWLALRTQVPLRRRIVGAVLHALPYGLVIVLHFAVLNRVPVTSPTLLALLENTLAQSQKYLGVVFGPESGRGWLLAAVALAGALGLALGGPRSRVFVVWAIFAPFPYVAMGFSLRYLYMFQLCFAAALPIALGERRVVPRAVVAVILTGLFTLQVWRLPAALQEQREAGDVCRRGLTLLESQDLSDLDYVYTGVLPEELRKDLPHVLALYIDRPLISRIGSIAAPPFVILPDGELPDDRTLFMHFDPTTRQFAVSSRGAMLGDNIPTPMVALVEQYEVEPNAASVLTRLRSGEVDLGTTVILESPPPAGMDIGASAPEAGVNRIVRTGAGMGHIRLEVDIDRPCILVLSLPGNVLDAGWTATVDGVAAPIVRANGMFSAVFLRPGQYHVAIDA